MDKGIPAEYVIVDVETTGLDAATDELIEIAAVKLRRGLVMEEFCTLVKAQHPIPPFISELTGIHDDLLIDQPGPREAVDLLVEFIGTAEIAAHNAAFDAAFICRYWQDKRPWLDTITLTQVAFPTLNSYSLSNLCEVLEIENDQAHRALGDARATARLFLRARKQLATLPMRARENLLLLAGEEKGPLEDLIRGQCSGLGAAAEQAPPKTESRPPNRLTDENYRIPLEAINNYFAADGLYQQRIAGFEYREAQLKMALQVAASLNDKRFLMAEAGTGTGKSLA
ncbi:MAG: exonuclease domain-containing protein, partial [Clostridiales bacterium]|nr:exonuclease domain-containing protein [Clostridiales bacterium]